MANNRRMEKNTKRLERRDLPLLVLLATAMLAGCAFNDVATGEVLAAPRVPGESHLATYLRYQARVEGGMDSAVDSE